MTSKERDELRKNAYASLDQMTNEQFMQFYDSVCEDHGLPSLFAEELNSIEKPPLGLAPPGIVYDLRMREISEAILRYLDPERTIGKESYVRIAKWAEELHEVALLMVKLLK